MAFFANTDIQHPSFIQSTGQFFRTLFSAIDLTASANARVAEMEKWNALSDEQLAAKGMRREDIARYVFRDILHI